MWEGFNDSGMDGGILACDLPSPTKSASDVKSPTPKKMPKPLTEPDTQTDASQGSKGLVSKVNYQSRSTHEVSFTCIFLKHIFFVVEFLWSSSNDYFSGNKAFTKYVLCI